MKSLEASESVFLPLGGLAPPLGATIVQPPTKRHATASGHGARLVAGWPRFFSRRALRPRTLRGQDRGLLPD